MVLHPSLGTNQLDSNGFTSNHKNKPAGLQWFYIQEHTGWTQMILHPRTNQLDSNGFTSKPKNKPAGLQQFYIQA